MNCKYCKANCQKAGKQRSGVQKYYCTHCKKYQQLTYQYKIYEPSIKTLIPSLVCNGVGIRSIARVLGIAPNTAMRHILLTAKHIPKPPIPLHKPYIELDELRTYILRKTNQYWVAYALCSQTKAVLDFIVGKRSKTVLRIIVNNLLASQVAIIKTDKLNIYQALIPTEKHIAKAYNINHIERHNLNLRTHIKRLNRRTICYSKSITMLSACLKIYFWYQ